MARTNLSSIFLIFLYLSATFASSSFACKPCKPKVSPPWKPKVSPPCQPKVSPPKGPSKTPPASPSCPRDTLKFGVCADVLGGLLNFALGAPPSSDCCALLNGLTDFEAAACLCTTIKGDVLGIHVEWSVSLSLLLSTCKRSIPPGFQCV
ncbi:hypothetical protein MKW94_022643 [Papaver nudicaule]|uniref:Bifunctional inhibitor/plant lipid transfer protein/seed storage helical domain-containing protein n=1 Tax=Papaver nudicaule TaxID=74823 RepID=A0AA41RQ29_PAPNU|nr:hypothetical protein [Papaver nudicaule]